MIDWRGETDSAIIECLRKNGPLSVAEVGRRVGISESEAGIFIFLLVREGKLRIGRVELSPEERARRGPAVSSRSSDRASGPRAVRNAVGRPRDLRQAPSSP